jgi:5-methylcytosine-specific restriction endonuclease McrA
MIFLPAMAKKRIDYYAYIKSEAWKKKRLKRLKMDDFKCQFKIGRFKCGAKTNLEIHHLTYKNLGNERFKELITLCHRHHVQVHNQ